jgi:hypothetical protein
MDAAQSTATEREQNLRTRSGCVLDHWTRVAQDGLIWRGPIEGLPYEPRKVRAAVSHHGRSLGFSAWGSAAVKTVTRERQLPLPLPAAVPARAHPCTSIFEAGVRAPFEHSPAAACNLADARPTQATQQGQECCNLSDATDSDDGRRPDPSRLELAIELAIERPESVRQLETE